MRQIPAGTQARNTTLDTSLHRLVVHLYCLPSLYNLWLDGSSPTQIKDLPVMFTALIVCSSLPYNTVQAPAEQ
nr:hypothetical protein [uncultured Comamonas sp.]